MTTIKNEYIPFPSQIQDVIKQTDVEYTFVMTYKGDVKPGQFFEVSLPKFGEAPISVSGIGNGTVDLTIRRVGKVTDEIFENYIGDTLFMRGPYGNGFNIDQYKDTELVVIAGGTGLSPVRGVINYFAEHIGERKSLQVIAGFRNTKDILFKEDQERWAKTSSVITTVDCPDGATYCKEGMVTEHIPNLHFDDVGNAIAIVVGPPMMMHFTVQSLIEHGFQEKNIWVSQERKMCCGIGKCGHCKVGKHYVCLDGPVFNYTSAKHLID